MDIHLNDDDVKDAIWEWLRARMTTLPDPTTVTIRRLYWNEGSGFDAVIEKITPKA